MNLKKWREIRMNAATKGGDAGNGIPERGV
jgi:hypothetical protein